MKNIIKQTACVQDPLNDFKKKSNIKNDNEALFIAVLIADSLLGKGQLTDIVEKFKTDFSKVRITRR